MRSIVVGFVGAGQMATALAAGICEAGMLSGSQIRALDPSPQASAAFQQRVPGCTLARNLEELVQDASHVVLAVKPQVLPAVGPELAPLLTPTQQLVSVIAGTSLAELRAVFGSPKILRVMPNTPCLIGVGASCVCGSEAVSDAEIQLVLQWLRAVGVADQVPESWMDAVTGLSGSGPAFVYTLVEAMADGGVRAGLPRELALKLAAQTVSGAAQMVLQSGEHPGVLKDRVASPGGTTIAGLQQLELRGFRGTAMAAVVAAAERARQLGQPSPSPSDSE